MGDLRGLSGRQIAPADQNSAGMAICLLAGMPSASRSGGHFLSKGEFGDPDSDAVLGRWPPYRASIGTQASA